MLSKAEVEARLISAGAFWLITIDDQYEVWCTAWLHHFCVPIADPASTMYDEDVREIEQEIIRSRP